MDGSSISKVREQQRLRESEKSLRKGKHSLHNFKDSVYD